MRIFPAFRFLVLSAAFFCGCSSAPPRPELEIVRDPMDLEVVTLEDQMLSNVMESATKFIVDPLEDAYSWERAILFFKHYTAAALPQEEPRDDSTAIISNAESAGDKYLYLVRRSWVPGAGYSYEVECIPRLSQSYNVLSQRNARNLSRFIRDGTLELSLLDR